MEKIYDVKTISICKVNIETVFGTLCDYQNNIAYIVDENNKLYGILSRGDVKRYARNKNKEETRTLVRTKFTWLQEDEADKAEDIFENNPKILEIPVVNKEKEILYLIRKEQIERVN